MGVISGILLFRHCERSEAISIFRKSQIDAAAFDYLAITNLGYKTI